MRNFNKIILSIVLIALSNGGTVLAQSPLITPKPTQESAPSFTHDQITIQTQSGETHDFNIEIAITPQQQAYGMMNRTIMAEDFGMLFVFKDVARRSFWMKNTLIPLDMVFIDRDGVINHIHHKAVPHDLTPVKPKVKAYAVLELKGGVAEKLKLNIGDKVDHAFFKHIDMK